MDEVSETGMKNSLPSDTHAPAPPILQFSPQTRRTLMKFVCFTACLIATITFLTMGILAVMGKDIPTALLTLASALGSGLITIMASIAKDVFGARD